MTRSGFHDLIETFLTETGMGPSYFGTLAVGNSKLVPRLRAGRNVDLSTAEKVVEFIRIRRSMGADPITNHTLSDTKDTPEVSAVSAAPAYTSLSLQAGSSPVTAIPPGDVA